ncbi:hypothetical protein NBRC116495_25120 [Aurantivibrio plasticivorans]
MKKINGNVTLLRPGSKNIYIINPYGKKPDTNINSPLITPIHKNIDKKLENPINTDELLDNE